MPLDPHGLEDIFAEARTIAGASARAAYLDQACVGNSELRQRVEALLTAHDAAGSFLKLPEPVDATIPFVELSERPGSRIGRFKLLEQIGEGGFGVVFMAEQEQPVRRMVALKVIKLGMDTRQVVARFEAERQALAMMDHPNVAKVLDGGTTDTGRPYFVMELVKGTPITEYCDKNNLSIRQRLELFSQVCLAVQHAHQKGLIHRDIKPTNVLVMTQDDRPVAKVIDFGVAKAMQARLTEKTLFTEFHQLVGTPAYMSPEQAAGGLDIDTRSDVYSLGVLLYELLTGSPPFDPQELRSKSFAEMQRIICEVEPPTPSTRLDSLSPGSKTGRGEEGSGWLGTRRGEVRVSAGLASIAAQRSIEPRKLAAIVHGELDWIVMRCLEKDRTRRYETANALAEDIQHYLTDQPVEACPPSAIYRFRKFARRNKAALAIAGLVALLLLSTVAILTASNARIRRESAARAVALKEKDAALATARQAVDQMLVRVGDETLADLPLTNPLRRALLEDALKFYDGFVQQSTDDDALRFELGRVLQKAAIIQRDLGRFDDARRSTNRSIEILEKVIANTPHETEYRNVLATSHHVMAFLWMNDPKRRNYSLAETHCRKALELYKALERDHPDKLTPTVGVLVHLAKCAAARGDVAEALSNWEESQSRGIAYLEQNPTASLERNSLCWSYLNAAEATSDATKKETWLQAAMQHSDIQLRQYPRKITARFVWYEARMCLADLYVSSDRANQAIPLYEQALKEVMAICAETLHSHYQSPNHFKAIRRMFAQFATCLRQAGRDDELKLWLDRYLKWYQTVLLDAARDPLLPSELWECQVQLVELLRTSGEGAKADAVLQETFARLSTIELSSDQALQDPSRLAWRAIGQCGLGHWKKALADFQSAESRSLNWNDIPLALLVSHMPCQDVVPDSIETEGQKRLREYLIERVEHRAARDGNAWNLIAWSIVSSDDLDRRHSKLGLKWAKKANQFNPNNGGVLTTLGVAQYRAGDWPAAIHAIKKGMELRNGGDAFGWFYLAMAEWQLGHKDEARALYDKAVAWMDKNQPKNEELLRFRAEAAKLLGISEPAPSTAPTPQP